MTHSMKAGLFALALAVTAIPAAASAATLTRQLDLGMTGSDVSALQAYLALDASIYPQGLVTGYYGALTSAAVSVFQSRNDIPSVGRVGPITISVLNAKMNGGVSTAPSTTDLAPVISNAAVSVGPTGAVVNWNTNEPALGVVYYSTSPLQVSESLHAVSVSGSSVKSDSNFKTTQSVSIPSLDSNTTYYYLVYSTDVNGNASVTWPSTFKTSSSN